MAWIPGLRHDPGKNAGYRSGRTSRQLVVQHFTVGRDSYGLIKNNGLAAFLLPKSGVPWQFAEADAVTAHACEWNRAGAGLEFERLSWDEPLTDDQIHWGGVIVRWFADNYGIPLVLHDGARLPIGDGFRGSVNHGALVHRACDQHTDGITQDDFARMIGTATVVQSPTRNQEQSAMQTVVHEGAYKEFYIDNRGNLVIAAVGDPWYIEVLAGPDAGPGRPTDKLAQRAGLAVLAGYGGEAGRLDVSAVLAKKLVGNRAGSVHVAWTGGGWVFEEHVR